MAIRLLSPGKGTVKVLPPASYEETAGRYAEQIASAIRQEEDADIARMIRRMEQGDITFETYKKYIKDRIATYPQDSARVLALQEALAAGRQNYIRIVDLRGQNDD